MGGWRIRSFLEMIIDIFMLSSFMGIFIIINDGYFGDIFNQYSVRDTILLRAFISVNGNGLIALLLIL